MVDALVVVKVAYMESINYSKKWKQPEQQGDRLPTNATQFLPSYDTIGDRTSAKRTSIKRTTLRDYSLVNNAETPSQFKQPTRHDKRQSQTPGGQLSYPAQPAPSPQSMYADRPVVFAPNISLPTQRDVVTTPSQHSIAPGSLASYYSMDSFMDRQRAHLSAVLSNPVTPLWREYYTEAIVQPQAQAPATMLVLAAIPGSQSMPGTVSRVTIKRRNFFAFSAILLLIVFLLFGTLVVLFPVESTTTPNSFRFLQPLMHMIAPAPAMPSSRTIVAATATAVTQDGYDPGGSRTFAGVPQVPGNQHHSVVEEHGLNRFFYGQCTYWANMRYHQLTGHWVPWVGSAYQWAYQAPVAGWRIGDLPNPHGPSILVLAPNVQGAGMYGHVGVVEKVNRDGTVLVSSWNWKGAWGKESRETIHIGRGVSFIWYD